MSYNWSRVNSCRCRVPEEKSSQVLIGGTSTISGRSIFLTRLGGRRIRRIRREENWNSRSFAKWVRLGRVRLGNYKPSASRVGTTLKLLTNFRLTRHLWRHEISRLSFSVSLSLLALAPSPSAASLLHLTDFPKLRAVVTGFPAQRNEDILGRAISLNFAGRGKQHHLTWRKS